MSHGHSSGSNKMLLSAIAVVIVVYLITLLMGLPQAGTQMVVDAKSHHGESHGDAHGEKSPAEPEATGETTAAVVPPSAGTEGTAAAPVVTKEEAKKDAHGATDGHHAEDGHHAGDEEVKHPPFWMIIPFAALLLCIAILPLLEATEEWWEHNKNRFFVAVVLGMATLVYYFAMHETAVVSHWPAHNGTIIDVNPETAHDVTVVDLGHQGLNNALTVFSNALLAEYIPFIMLLFSLYTISGGIRIEGDLKAHPLTNTTIIGIGALLASFIGTTGAAMLLIRLLLETNKERKHVKHTVIFFIFAVCNCGGLLLPIGDPPLFLGYLRGVPFTWTLCLTQEWIFVNVALLVVYFVWDTFFAYHKETKSDIIHDEMRTTRLRFSGMLLNVPLLVAVIFAVALLDPSKAFPGTDWHPWMFFREIVMLALVGISVGIGSKKLREANQFNYHAIIEVAALFCGIFICMQAPLQILNEKGDQLGLDKPQEYFWVTGFLSSFLDNAPTYVVFFDTAIASGVPTDEETGEEEDSVDVGGRKIAEKYLIAISLGAVFMGAMTYIGNGPNFMVRAIADSSGVKMPSFFGYMAYSCCVLLPILLIMTLIFL